MLVCLPFAIHLEQNVIGYQMLRNKVHLLENYGDNFDELFYHNLYISKKWKNFFINDLIRNHQLYMITRTWLAKTSIEEYWLIVNQYTKKFYNAMTSFACFIRRQTIKKPLKNVMNTLAIWWLPCPTASDKLQILCLVTRD